MAVGAAKRGEVRAHTVEESLLPGEWTSVCIESSSDAQCRHCANVQLSRNGNRIMAAWGNCTFSVFDVQTLAHMLALIIVTLIAGSDGVHSFQPVHV